MKKFRLGRIFLLAFMFRLILTVLDHHSDADNTFYWAKYLWETKDFLFFLGESVPDAVRANYPPLFYYLIYLWRGLYDLVGRLLWFLNLKLPIFPSNLIFWYQTHRAGVAFNKILGILADLGCGWIIFETIKIIIKKESCLARSAVALFLFLPPAWYNSAFWGQDESLYAFFILLGFLLAFKEYYLLGTICLGLSVLIKPVSFFVFPAFFLQVLKRKKTFDFLIGLLLFSVITTILYFPFLPLDTVGEGLRMYLGNFRGELTYLVANAFNLWALVYGFEPKPSDLQLLGMTASFWGYVIFFGASLAIAGKLWRKVTYERTILAAFLFSFAAFLFLPKMHERYFYLALIFLVILAGIKRTWTKLLVVLSLIHSLNLYHFWWRPKIPFLISFLSSTIVLRGIIMINLIIFFYCLKELWLSKEKQIVKP